MRIARPPRERLVTIIARDAALRVGSRIVLLYKQITKFHFDHMTRGSGRTGRSNYELVERATGRLRPFQTRSSSAFFAGGRSFTSQDAVIESALATGTSAYYGNRWYVAVPLYSPVLLEGFTLTGNSSQWFSDVVGGALLGWTTAKALLWLHERQALEPYRWRIFPLAAPITPANPRVSNNLPAVSLGVSYSW